MAEMKFSLSAAPAVDGVDRTIGANRIVERDDLALVSIAVPHGGEAALAKALDAGWSLTYPTPTVASRNGDTYVISTAPDQLLLMFPYSAPDAERTVRQTLERAGYTTDQTGAWVAVEITGPETQRALERLCPLNTARFSPGGAARTVMEHMGAIILRLDADRFLLLSASSSARSFLHAVETSYRNTQG